MDGAAARPGSARVALAAAPTAAAAAAAPPPPAVAQQMAARGDLLLRQVRALPASSAKLEPGRSQVLSAQLPTNDPKAHALDFCSHPQRRAEYLARDAKDFTVSAGSHEQHSPQPQ